MYRDIISKTKDDTFDSLTFRYWLLKKYFESIGVVHKCMGYKKNTVNKRLSNFCSCYTLFVHLLLVFFSYICLLGYFFYHTKLLMDKILNDDDVFGIKTSLQICCFNVNCFILSESLKITCPFLLDEIVLIINTEHILSNHWYWS